MEMSSLTAERLPCGRTLDDVWAGLGADPDRHARDCLYCQQARDDLNELLEITKGWRDSGSDDPDQQPSQTIKTSIMDVVRAEFKAGRRFTVRHTEFGAISVREGAVAQLVRDATAVLPGVWARGCRLDQPGDDDEPDDHLLRATIGLSVAARALRPELLDTVRAAISDQLRRDLDLGATNIVIDLVVEDVHE